MSKSPVFFKNISRDSVVPEYGDLTGRARYHKAISEKVGQFFESYR